MMRRVVWIVLVALWAVGCTPKPEGAVVADTPRRGWEPHEEVAIIYDNTDTLSLYNVGVALRVESSRVEGPVSLKVECESPLGSRFESSVVLRAEGVHSGGSFTEIKAPWVEKALFGESGEYLFILTPEQELKGVWMAAITIEK
jgi:hypothetical protein